MRIFSEVSGLTMSEWRYVAMIHYFLYFIILRSVLKTPKAWSIYLNTSIVASTLMACTAQVAGKFTINQGDLGRMVW